MLDPSSAGGEIFFQSGDRIMVATVETDPSFRVTAEPQELFTLSETPRISLAQLDPGGFDVTPDGRRFLIFSENSDRQPTKLRVVVNWIEELRRLVPHP